MTSRSVLSPSARLARRALVSTVLVGLLLAPAACGGDDGATATQSTLSGSDPDGVATSSSEATGTATRTITDVFGEVEVPADPQRVVFLDATGLGNALALGLPMERVAGVAFDGTRDNHAYLEAEFGPLDDLVDLGGGIYTTLNFEQIVDVDPDLIVMLGFPDDDVTADAKAKLEATGVPTFAAFNGYNDLDESMRLLRDVGAALGREDRAAELEAAYRAEVDATIAGLPDARPSMNAVRVFAPNDVWIQAHWLMDDIGLERSAPETPELFLDISDEQLNLADADILFVSGDGGPEASLAAVESNPLWTGLSAVQSGQVIPVEDQPWGTDYSYPALVIILDTIADALAEYADTAG